MTTAVQDKTEHDIKAEYPRLLHLIDETREITKEDIDSMFDSPCLEHRLSHQQRWIKRYQERNKLDYATASRNFCQGPEQRRFNIWYAQKYLSHLKNPNHWAVSVINDARNIARQYYNNQPLEEIVV